MALPIELSWKNTRAFIEVNTYTGDGVTTARTIDLGFTPGLVVIYALDENDLALTSNSSNYLQLDSGSLNEGSEQTDTHLTANGFVVGDGDDDFNTNGDNYIYLAYRQSGETRISWKNTLSRTEFGQYDGDGTTTGREIDTGFAADFTFIQTDGSANFWFTMDQTNAAQAAPSLVSTFATADEVHNSANGFTVGDGDDIANQSGESYNYVAIQLTGTNELSWKNDRMFLERDSYTGDGTTTGRTITAAFDIDFVFIQEDAEPNSFIISTNTTEGMDLAPSLANSVSTTTDIHKPSSGDGFVVGDGGTDGNENGTVYNYLAIGIE